MLRKMLLALATLVLFSVGASAQITSNPTDSTGTATVYWQKVDLLNSNEKWVDIVNEGSVDLYYCIVASDTVAGRTRYQPKITVLDKYIKIFTKTRYVYVKTATGTCNYRIEGY